MAECAICEIMKDRSQARLVYEDEHAIAMLHPKPSAIGHVLLTPKIHYPIFESMDDSIISHLFNLASKISSSIFDTMSIQGTNIFVQNGLPAGQKVPHFMIHIIPRKEGDGIGLQWTPKQMTTEQLSAVELMIREALDAPKADIEESIPIQEDNTPTEANPSQPKDRVPPEENYLLKQLRRIP